MVRVFLLTNDDLTSHVVFEPLFESPRVEVAGVAFTTTLLPGTSGLASGVAEMYRRVGPRYWSYLVWTNGWAAVFDRAGARWRSRVAGWPASLRRACRTHRVPVHRSADFNAPRFVEVLREAAPDLLLIRVNQILDAAVLGVPRHGTWCVHSSLLPSFKGIAAEFHALRTGASRLGTTIFEVTEQLDAGRPLFQTEIAVDRTRSVFDHMTRNNVAAAELLCEQLERFDETRAVEPDLRAPETEPSYHTWPTRAEVRALRRAGGRLIGLRECATLAARCLSLTT